MELLLSSIALSLLAVGSVWLVGRRDPACSPILTLSCLVALLALPALAFLPKIHFELPAAPVSGEADGVGAISWLAIAWLVGFALFVLRLFADWVSLLRWRRHSSEWQGAAMQPLLETCHRQVGLRRRIAVRVHPRASSPVIAGLLRPVIFLPPSSRNWSEDTLRMVLLHELGHVVRRDLWTSLAARIACLIHWFNPLVWWLRHRLMAQCEFACDAKVVAAGADPAGYATALCDVAEAISAPRAALAMAGRASLRQRVERLVRCPRSSRSLLVGAALIVTATSSLALSVVRFSAPANDPVYTPEEIRLRLTADPFPRD